jgi:hypothetical protein
MKLWIFIITLMACSCNYAMNLKWECIAECDSKNVFADKVYRVPIQNGWLVKLDDYRRPNLIFVPDAKHLWR